MVLNTDVLPLSNEEKALLVVYSCVTPIFIKNSVLNFKSQNPFTSYNKQHILKIFRRNFIFLFHESVNMVNFQIDTHISAFLNKSHFAQESINLLSIEINFTLITLDIKVIEKFILESYDPFLLSDRCFFFLFNLLYNTRC